VLAFWTMGMIWRYFIYEVFTELSDLSIVLAGVGRKAIDCLIPIFSGTGNQASFVTMNGA